MDEAIIKRFYRLYGMKMDAAVLPMNIHEFGNSSVATVPTLYDLVRKTNYGGHKVQAGDLVIFASVGAGMNINAICYRIWVCFWVYFHPFTQRKGIKSLPLNHDESAGTYW